MLQLLLLLLLLLALLAAVATEDAAAVEACDVRMAQRGQVD